MSDLIQIFLHEYYTDEHSAAIRRMLHALDGVKIMHESDACISIKAEENIMLILKDMDRCDYISMQGNHNL